MGYSDIPCRKGKTCAASSASRFGCNVANTGARELDEVVQVYHAVGTDIRASIDHPAPKRKLVAFERITLPAGGSAPVAFDIPAERLHLTTTMARVCSTMARIR